jgi:hypothetical protein
MIVSAPLARQTRHLRRTQFLSCPISHGVCEPGLGTASGVFGGPSESVLAGHINLLVPDFYVDWQKYCLMGRTIDWRGERPARNTGVVVGGNFFGTKPYNAEGFSNAATVAV